MSKQNGTHSLTDQNGEIVLTVIAPCYHEQDNIDALVDRTLTTFDAMDISSELVLVDDGSRDQTWERIQHRSTLDPRVRGVRHQHNRGIKGSWSSGLEVARGELVCLIDADLQNRPEDIAVLVRAYKKRGCDVIQAVRHSLDRNFLRGVCTRGLNLLLNSVFGTRLRDNKSGFILCRRETMTGILKHRFHYRYYQCFVGVSAGSRGLTIGEVDTVFEHRCHGRSFLANLPLWVCTKIVWEIFKFRVELWMETRKRSAGNWRELARADVRSSGGHDPVPGVSAEMAASET